MTSTTLGRFQILSYNELQYPHKCGTCGSFSGDNNKRFIDFGCWVEYYGTVYICTECFLGAVSLLEVVPAKQLKAAEDQVRELKAVVTTLISENRTLRDAVDSLRNIDRSYPNTDDDSNSTEQVTERGPDSAGQREEVSSPDPERHDSSSTEGESGPSEQTNVGRHQDVRNDDSTDEQSIGLNVFDI